MEPKECMLSKIKALDEAMSEIENKLKRIQETPKTNRFEPYVGTSEGLGPPSYMCNSWRNAQDASSYQQQFVGNREFNSGNRYQHDAYPSTYYKHGWENYLNSHDQSQWQGQPSWEQNQGESNLQYQNQWQGQPSWEQNQGESNLQYQSQWQGQPSWEQNQRETDFQYQRQWQGQPSWEQNQFLHREAGVTSSQPTWEQNLFSHREAGLTSSQPTLHDKILAMIGDKAPKNDFYEPKTTLYGSQAPTSLPEVIPPLKGQMDQLSNSFSLLDVDTNGDIEQTIMADTKAVKKKDIAFDPIVENELMKDSDMVSSNYRFPPIVENELMKDSDMVSSNYRFPLVWIDLEMTGLDIETDRILEIACIITDGSLTKSIEGPDIVIHQKKECLDKMGEWCQKHHAASGLTEKVTRSLVTEREAEKQVIEFVKKYVGGTYYRPLLAGNSVYVDLLFLKKYMPELASLFGHVLVDVSSIKALCIRWFTRDHRNAPRKEKKHRAMDDIKESIAELKYYKDAIFKPSKF